MNKVLTLAVGAVVAAATSQAAITWGPWAETATTLSGSANWDGSPDPETASTVSPGGNWWVSLTFSSTVKSYSVVLDGQHLVAPHPDDSAPGDVIESSLGFHIVLVEEVKKENDTQLYRLKQIFARKATFVDWLSKKMKTLPVWVFGPEYRYDKGSTRIEFRDASWRQYEDDLYEKASGDPSFFF